MEAMAVSEKRKRPSPSFNGGPVGSKHRRSDSPRQRPRPRSSDPLSRDFVKDLRSHRVFSPSSELSRNMVSQKLGFDFGFAESEKKETKHTGKGDLGFLGEDRAVFNAVGVSVEKSESSVGNGLENGCDFRDKSFIRPCVRQKVFKTPGSVSYKRLLPYLINMSEMNSCDRGIGRCPKLEKGFQEKICSSMEPAQSDDASKDYNKNTVSAECQNGNSNTMVKIEADCVNKSFDGYEQKLTSSEIVASSPCITGSDKCFVETIVNGNICKSDVSKSPDYSMAYNMDSLVPIAVEDLIIVNDNASLTSSDDKKRVGNIATDKMDDGLSIKMEDNIAMREMDKLVGNIGTDKMDDGLTSKLEDNVAFGEMDDGIPSKVQDRVIANMDFARAASGSHFGKDDELDKHSEDLWQPVSRVPFESQKQTEIKDHKGRDGGHIMNHADDLNEASNQMTPPDPEIFVGAEAEGNEADTPDYVLYKKHNLNGMPSRGVNNGIASLGRTRHDINSKCRGVSKPRSQLKLFRSPGSFSYRRMLPFLMDIAKDNQDAVPTSRFEKPSEKDVEQRASPASDNPENPLDKSNSGSVENQKDASVMKPLSVTTPLNGPTTDSESLLSVVNYTESQMPLNAETVELLQVKEDVSDSPSTPQPSSNILMPVESRQDIIQPVSLLCSTNLESKSIEFAISKCNPITSEVEGESSRLGIGFDDLKSVDADRPCYLLSQHDYLISSKVNAYGPKRGILKRNPRGCRGLCTCLNCASFRLHAERAFEFSRNQMEDTEELVIELINKLSYLRNVLEKSANLDHDHQVNQVKEACKQASEAEQLAKNRLSHMNYDLGVHCQLNCVERPRVKFAKHVEEHIITKPVANFPIAEVLKEQRDSWRRDSNHTGCFRQ